MERKENKKTVDSFNQIYADKDIFLTGATGLTGKALVEKILRSVPTVKKIFVLIRDKKNHTFEQRIAEYKTHRIFERLRSENPAALDKLCGIPGDIGVIGLGLSSESIEKLKNVSFIFHCAATVRFDEHLRKAVFLNLRGTREMLNFALNLKKLELFIHVSTMYSNPSENYVKEALYPAKCDWRTVLKMAETYDDAHLNGLTPKLLGDFPNTYTFTKHLTEHVVQEYNDKIPVMIVRPSIVNSSSEEPVPGWYDNFNGMMGVVAAVNTGIVRTVYCDSSRVIDLIPIDVLVKATIFAVWYHLKYERVSKMDQVSVFNLAVAFYRGYSMYTMSLLDYDCIEEVAYNKAIWKPNFGFTSNIYLFYLQFYLFNLLPAVIFDILLRIFGQDPFMLKLQRRNLSSQMSVHFFAFNEYKFEYTKFMKMFDHMGEHPDFSLERSAVITSKELSTAGILGLRRYLLNEDDSSIPAARKRLRIFNFLDWTIKNALFAWIAYKLCYYCAVLAA